MSFSGYILKIGNFIFPMEYIIEDSMQITKTVQDLDSYRDSNGVLHRNALEHWVANITFDVVPFLNGEELASLMGSIRMNYIILAERKANVTVFVPEVNDYITQAMYMPDIQIPIFTADRDGTIWYQSFSMEFIGY